MSIQAALNFIQQVRSDREVQNQIAILDDNLNTDSYISFGRELGFDFSRQELEAAHKQDWGMRWMLYKAD